nr:MAG TPA: hypothetical protein [Caudoviricetes sp.]
MGWEEKLLEEFKALEEHINHLITFLDDNKDHEDYYILCKQLSAMIEYRECLDTRIKKYNIK